MIGTWGLGWVPPGWPFGLGGMMPDDEAKICLVCAQKATSKTVRADKTVLYKHDGDDFCIYMGGVNK